MWISYHSINAYTWWNKIEEKSRIVTITFEIRKEIEVNIDIKRWHKNRERAIDHQQQQANIGRTYVIFVEYLSGHKLQFCGAASARNSLLCYSRNHRHTKFEESDSFVCSTHDFYNFSSYLLHRINAWILFVWFVACRSFRLVYSKGFHALCLQQKNNAVFFCYIQKRCVLHFHSLTSRRRFIVYPSSCTKECHFSSVYALSLCC